jgi:hypothetical protein
MTALEELRGTSMKKVLPILMEVRCHRLRNDRTLMVALVLVGASAASAQQVGDLCFHYESGCGKLVARRAGGLPEPDHCKPLQFYEDVNSGGLNGAATGSICTDPSGVIAVFHYTYHSCRGRSYFETATCRFSVQHGLPASGVCRGTADQSGFFDSTPKLESCNIHLGETVGLCLR